MTDITDGALAPAAGSAVNKYYFIAWRWHFYAGLYVMPFLIMSAITGLTMLWISWSAGIGGERIAVVPQESTLSVSVLQAAAEAAVPGSTATQYVEPLAADRVATFAVATDDATVGVAIDPYTGIVVHTFPWRAGWYDFATDIHGTLLMGSFGDLLIEIAASLAIVMVITSLYLQWPRNGTGWRRTLLPRFSARGRVDFTPAADLSDLRPQLVRRLGREACAGMVNVSGRQVRTIRSLAGRSSRQHEPRAGEGGPVGP